MSEEAKRNSAEVKVTVEEEQHNGQKRVARERNAITASVDLTAQIAENDAELSTQIANAINFSSTLSVDGGGPAPTPTSGLLNNLESLLALQQGGGGGAGGASATTTLGAPPPPPPTIAGASLPGPEFSLLALLSSASKLLTPKEMALPANDPSVFLPTPFAPGQNAHTLLRQQQGTMPMSSAAAASPSTARIAARIPAPALPAAASVAALSPHDQFLQQLAAACGLRGQSIFPTATAAPMAAESSLPQAIVDSLVPPNSAINGLLPPNNMIGGTQVGDHHISGNHGLKHVTSNHLNILSGIPTSLNLNFGMTGIPASLNPTAAGIPLTSFLNPGMAGHPSGLGVPAISPLASMPDEGNLVAQSLTAAGTGLSAVARPSPITNSPPASSSCHSSQAEGADAATALPLSLRQSLVEGQLGRISTVAKQSACHRSQVEEVGDTVVMPLLLHDSLVEGQLGKISTEAKPSTMPLPYGIGGDAAATTLRQQHSKSLKKKASLAVEARKNVRDPLIKSREARWIIRYEELLSFRKEHGHCRVPHGYVANRKLSWWVMNQRAQYAHGQQGKKTWLTDQRIQLLNDIGFIWTPHLKRSGGERRKGQPVTSTGVGEEVGRDGVHESEEDGDGEEITDDPGENDSGKGRGGHLHVSNKTAL